MRKNSFLLSLVLLATLSTCLSNDNFRIGMSLGVNSVNAKVKSSLTQQRVKLVKNSPSAAIFGGLDHDIADTPMFIGLELEANNHNSEKEMFIDYGARTAGSNLKLKTNNSLSGAIRFGVTTDSTLLYAKAGIGTSNWLLHLKSVANVGAEDSRAYFQKIGYIGGFGMESKMSKSFSIGLEHQYTINRKFTFSYREDIIKVNPLNQTTSFRLIYSF
jgi:opacity protein-like surface antigen